MSLTRYAEYKDGGDALFGEVPSHWRRSALKRLADYQNGYAFKPEDWATEGKPIIRIAQLTGDAEPNYFAGELDEKVRVENGDLLFSWSATIDSFLWASGPAWLNQHIFKVSPTGEAISPYLFYLIKFVAPKLADLDAHGSTMRHIKKESLGQLVYAPPIDEQGLIAAFLDRETAKIDALIAEQEKLIALLAEKRQATISHAVTRGLNPEAPMKDSGVEWLGEIPAHWRLHRGRFLFTQADDPPRAEDGVVTAFRDGQVTLRENRRTDGFTQAILEVGYQHVQRGDLVIHGMDAFAGAIGVSESDGKCTPEYSVLRGKDPELSNFYFAATLRVMAKRNFIYVICPSVRERAPRFRYESFKNVWLPIPPPEEQSSIVQHIADELGRIDKLSSKAAELVKLLVERRGALIAAAVTGQIDVRGAVVALQADEAALAA